MIGVEHSTGQAAPQPGSGFQGVGDEVGAHVLGDRPPATRREQQSITVARYRLPPVANGR